VADQKLYRAQVLGSTVQDVSERRARDRNTKLAHGSEVVQAAGRLIRTPQDHGVLYLMDEHFDGARVRRLLPPAWNCQGGVNRGR
jgi:hypothetical protein